MCRRSRSSCRTSTRSASTTRTTTASGLPSNRRSSTSSPADGSSRRRRTASSGKIATAHLNGRESKLALQCPIEILIYVPEGVSANEYDFLRFRINSDNREFRVLTGGVFHSTGGADRDEVKFNPSEDCSAHLPVHRRQRHRRRRVRHPAARHGQRHQRRQDLHVRHRRVETVTRKSALKRRRSSRRWSMLNSEDVESHDFATIMLTPCLTGHVADAIDAVPDA